MSRTVFASVEVGLVLILAACAGLVMTARPDSPGNPAAQPSPNVTAAPSDAPSASLVKPGGVLPPSIFFARPEGPKGIAFAYDAGDGRHLFTLPAGVLAADGQSYFGAEFVGDNDTKINRFDPATGEESLCLKLEGRWELSGLSPNGRWLALTRVFGQAEKQAWTHAGEWHTELQIVDTRNKTAGRVVKLDGNFEAETISADGSSLFLIEYLPAVEPDHYVIRLYDLPRQQLVAQPLRLKGSDEVMAGYAWEALPSKDGSWLLTLYLNTRNQEAFIHGLNMINQYTVCIDLPSDGGFEQLKYYSLSLAPDGQTVYAANAALGTVAEISLNDLQVRQTASFESRIPAPADLQSQAARSTLTPDGRTLYFTGGKDLVWAYDADTREVSGPFFTKLPAIAGLGVSPDGARLYAAAPDGLLLAFDTATRQTPLGSR